MINIQFSESIVPEGETPPIPPEHLERAALQTLALDGEKPQAELTIVIDNDDRLQELNRQFLEIDAPTDVLSFPSEITDPDSGERYLGDIIISLQRARAQALAGGHAVQDELSLLVVHGVLHLLGYDHADDEEKAAMWSAQSAALRALNCPLDPP